VIVPLVPSPLSIRMLRELRAFVADQGWSDLVLLPFFSMVDRRRSLHLELMASARLEFPRILLTEVPYRSEIERMTVRRTPLVAGAATSEAAVIYRQLWQEVVQQGPVAAAAAPPAPAAGVHGLATASAEELPQHR
jgi:chromosome partitioning protein